MKKVLRKLRAFLLIIAMIFATNLLVLNNVSYAADSNRSFICYEPNGESLEAIVNNHTFDFNKYWISHTINRDDVSNVTEEDLELLCNIDAMKEFLKQHDFDNVANLSVITATNIFDGYMVLIQTDDNQMWYMPLLKNTQTDSLFRNQTIYSERRLKRICGTQEAKLFLLGEEISLSTPVLWEFGNLKLPLKALMESMGYAVTCNENGKELSFTANGTKYEFKNLKQDKWGNYGISIYENGMLEHITLTCFYENDTLMLSETPTRILLAELGMKTFWNPLKHSIYIEKD